MDWDNASLCNLVIASLLLFLLGKIWECLYFYLFLHWDNIRNLLQRWCGHVRTLCCYICMAPSVQLYPLLPSINWRTYLLSWYLGYMCHGTPRFQRCLVHAAHRNAMWWQRLSQRSDAGFPRSIIMENVPSLASVERLHSHHRIAGKWVSTHFAEYAGGLHRAPPPSSSSSSSSISSSHTRPRPKPTAKATPRQRAAWGMLNRRERDLVFFANNMMHSGPPCTRQNQRRSPQEPDPETEPTIESGPHSSAGFSDGSSDTSSNMPRFLFSSDSE